MSNLIEQPRYSCALGVQQTVVAIKRSVPVLHSGPGCSVKIQALLGQGEGYAGGSTIPCTNSGEAEIVYGGEKRLRSVIDGAFEVIDADLYVVLTGCTSDIVGDDVGQIVSDYQNEGRPIVYAETGGFKSSNYVSHEIVVKAIIDQYVALHNPGSHVRKGLVNVFATVPYQDPYWEGNFEEIKRILNGLGLEVNILFGQRSGGVEEWKTIPDAELNLVVNAWVGVDIAEHLKSRYCTPYLHFPYLPIGGIETTSFLKQVIEAVDFTGEQKAKALRFIETEEEIYYSFIERMACFMLEFRYGIPRRFYSLLDASYSLGFSKFLLNELGILPAHQYIIDNTPEVFQDAIREQFARISDLRSAEVSFETDAGKIQSEIAAADISGRKLILGSGWERDLAKKINADLLPVSVPISYRLLLNCGYAGYKGGLRVIEDLFDRVLDTYR